jgi:hypothetical protein
MKEPRMYPRDLLVRARVLLLPAMLLIGGGIVLSTPHPQSRMQAGSQAALRRLGDTPPVWKFGGPHGIVRQPRGVTLDPAHKSVIVIDKRVNAVLTWYFPEVS